MVLLILLGEERAKLKVCKGVCGGLLTWLRQASDIGLTCYRQAMRGRNVSTLIGIPPDSPSLLPPSELRGSHYPVSPLGYLLILLYILFIIYILTRKENNTMKYSNPFRCNKSFKRGSFIQRPPKLSDRGNTRRNRLYGHENKGNRVLDTLSAPC